MKEALDNAREELKRVDHLFYVSLKYTRTADMIRHMIDRMISTFSFGIESLLKYAKENKKIDEIPSNPGLRSHLVVKTFQDQELHDYVSLYTKLRKIIRAKYSKREEFRRHVTMTCIIDNNQVVEVNIDVLREYYEITRAFIKYIKILVEGEEEL